MGADEGVSLPRPSQSGADGVIKVEVLQPSLLLLGEASIGDLDGKLPGPVASKLKGVAVQTAQQLLGNGAIPDVVEVELAAVKQDMDAVAALRDVLVVQRLVEVADKVHDKLGGLVALPERQAGLDRLLGVVCEGGDDAAVVLAVALKVDVALLGRAVVGVDEVERLCVPAPVGVADRVGPAGYLGDVVGALVVEQLLEVSFCRVGDEVAGEVGGGDVTKTCCVNVSTTGCAAQLEPLCTHCPMRWSQAGWRGRGPARCQRGVS